MHIRQTLNCKLLADICSLQFKGKPFIIMSARQLYSKMQMHSKWEECTECLKLIKLAKKTFKAWTVSSVITL